MIEGVNGGTGLGVGDGLGLRVVGGIVGGGVGLSEGDKDGPRVCISIGIRKRLSGLLGGGVGDRLSDGNGDGCSVFTSNDIFLTRKSASSDVITVSPSIVTVYKPGPHSQHSPSPILSFILKT